VGGTLTDAICVTSRPMGDIPATQGTTDPRYARERSEAVRPEERFCCPAT
jgi:hypothetical protein